MSSNDQWPPVASATNGKNSAKVNGSKRNIKESQQKILFNVNEIFGTALEPDVILNVVQNCNWELQPSIESLITLTETVDNPLSSNNLETTKTSSSATTTSKSSSHSPRPEIPKPDTISSNFPSPPNLDSRSIPPNLSQTPNLTSPPKLEKPRRTVTKNRMGSFCGNIAKLKSSEEQNKTSQTTSTPKPDQQPTPEKSFSEDCAYGATGPLIYPSKTFPKLPNYGNFPNLPQPPKFHPPEKKETDTNQQFLDSKLAAENKEFNEHRNIVSHQSRPPPTRKPESESLCGLKVQYRVSGMEGISDDDADVVIEDESSDYEINPSINVSQFLSPTSQTAPKRTQPQLEMISTPSPPRTPQRSVHDTTLNRIKASILEGHKILILLRGLPGSGKSTLAKSIIDSTIGGNSSAHVFSSDDFFVTLGRGIYQYDPTRIPEAHTTNQKRVWNAMKEGRSPIIIDNTHVEAWEMRPYTAMAVESGYTIEVLEPNTPWSQNINELAKKNRHNVPKAKIRDKFEKYEKNVTGKSLLERFSLKYTKDNKPPQQRLVPQPPINVNNEKAANDMADIQSNWGSHDENKFVLTSHDIESLQDIGDSRSARMSECPSVDEDSNESTTNNVDNTLSLGEKLFNEYFQDPYFASSDDESYDKLEGSGSDPSDICKTQENSTGTENCSQLGVGSSKHTPEDYEQENSTRTNDASPNSSQSLGAIGSERKVSLSVTNISNNLLDVKTMDGEKACKIAGKNTENDNVLSQCWDFTLILGRCKIHSTDKPPISESRDNDSRDINDELSISAQISKPKDFSVDNLIEKEQTSIDETLKLNNFAKDLIDDFEIVAKGKSDNDVDKISIEDKIFTEGKETNAKIEAEEFETCKIVQDCVKSLVDDTSSLLVEIEDKKKIAAAQNQSEIKDCSDEINCDNWAFNDYRLIKEFRETFESGESSVKNDATVSNSTVVENTDDEKKFARFVSDALASLDQPNWENLLHKGDVKNFEIAGCEEENSKIMDIVDGKLTKIVSTSYSDLSTNPFRDEMIKSQTENETTDENISTDNFNSISWKESPFPVDGTKIPVVAQFEDKKSVEITEASTNTSYYDLNVAYVGGTSEPEYRELWAISRDINEGPSVMKFERPPRKLMLDKSSMTSEEKEKESDDRIGELVEMFPGIPVKSLTAFYEQECNRNFDWAVELLVEDSPNGFTFKDFEARQSTIEDVDDKGENCNSEFKTKVGNDGKKRSHSSSPRYRRSRVKDLRSCSVEITEARGWIREEDRVCETSHRQTVSSTDLPTCSSSFDTEVSSNEQIEIEDETEDTMELNFGREFIDQLEKTFGNPGFTFPDGFSPVIRISKSMAEELYSLWIKSMSDQLDARHAQLDEMIAKDEAIARALDCEETLESEAESEVPNLDEIMDMEMAWASYKNELKSMIETPNEMVSRLSKQILDESDLSPDVLNSILKAHDEKELGKIRKISNLAALKKQQSLLERVKEESKNRGIEQNASNLTRAGIFLIPEGDTAEKLTYKDALAKGQSARMEAQKQLNLRLEKVNKATEYYEKGRPQVATYYSELARLHSENMDSANAEADEAFFSAHVYGNGKVEILDLHYLFVDEALYAVDLFIDDQRRKLLKSDSKTSTLHIITGWGARSSNGLSKLKPAVAKRLISKNIRFTEENQGCLKIVLSRKDAISD